MPSARPRRGLSGSFLDSVEAFVRGCNGTLAVLVVPPGEERRTSIMQRVAAMPTADLELLKRWLALRDHLPPVEMALLVEGGELRAERLSGAPASGTVRTLRRG